MATMISDKVEGATTMATAFDTRAGRMRYMICESILLDGAEHYSSLGYETSLARAKVKANRHDRKAIVLDAERHIRHDNGQESR